jgi:hypothetical protein
MINKFIKVSKNSWQSADDQIFVYGKGSALIEVFIEKGFVTDFATIPFPISLFFPKEGNYALPAAVHDKLYASRHLSKTLSDSIFYQAMKEAHVKPLIRNTLYVGVLLFGWLKWHK